MTAHYNAYFYAQERMREIETYVQNNTENNFNKILPVYPKLDSTLATTLKDQIEDCIRKSSLAIQYHPNSKWLDDSYVIVGKARFYSLEYADAVETFKFVNAKGEADRPRHEALIYLMRTFIEFDEYSNAKAVLDFLKKEEKIDQDLRTKLNLTLGYMHQKLEDYDEMVKYLVQAAPDIARSDDRARIYFIVGQVYQKLGFDAEAYHNYGMCLKSNPTYELSFYAKLYRAQVTELSEGSSLKTVRKYFKKLLKNPKNEEFRDKIYYEMAGFEVKQGNLDEAVDHYNASVRSSTSNRRQKGLSYLRLGELYYDNFKNFKKAKSYYDSVLQIMPQDEENYLAIQQRQKVLEEFVAQLTIIETQDSLLALSVLDSAALSAYVDDYISKKQEEKKVEEKKRAKAERRKSLLRNDDFSSAFDQFNEGGSSTWYFYNNSSVSQGRSEFLREWGQRPLEDNWRRKNKNTLVEANTTVDPSGLNRDNQGIEQAGTRPEQGKAINRQALIAAVPQTPEQIAAAETQVENALYKLGNIYNFDLHEVQNAAHTFDTLLYRFETSEYVPEVLYQNYLIYKKIEDSAYTHYRDRLLAEFPETVYAKLIANPNYREDSQLENEKLKAIYRDAFAYFEAGRYKEADSILSIGLNQYTDNAFVDNAQLLKVLINNKAGGNLYTYQFSLDEFIKDNPESELTEYAASLKTAAAEFEKKLAERRNRRYVEDFEQSHSFVLLYRTTSDLQETIPGLIDGYLQTTYADQNLVSANLVFDENYSMILIKQFGDQKDAMHFFESFNGVDSPIADVSGAITYTFVLTEDNFNIFYRIKDFQSYLIFFNKHYQKEQG